MSTAAASTDSPPVALRALASTALLGTDRTGGAKEAPRQLLRKSAVLGAMSRAGAAGVSGGDALPECAEESRAVASAGAAAILQKLLDQSETAGINEWCGLAVTRGVVVPAGLCPMLLDWWSRQANRDERVVSAMGERGRWLRALNPEWNKPGGASEPLPTDVESAWQVGTLAEREALLKAVRRSDAARARELVAATWSTDPADVRRRFVSALRQGLDASDETFLESCLDDRSKVVRRAAAELLATLPGSGLAARMLERTAAMISVNPRDGAARTPTITIEPPSAYDPAWMRDDIEEKAPTGRGQRAYWMSQILMATALNELATRVGMSADEFLAAIEDSEYFDDARTAVMHAAIEQGNVAWLAASANQILKHNKNVELLPSIWNRLPSGDAGALVLRVIGLSRVEWYVRWTLLGQTQFEWTAEFSEMACRAAGVPPKKRTDEWSTHAGIAEVSRRIHPGAVGEFQRAIEACFPQDLAPSIRASLDRARLRAEMHKEFSL